MKTLLRASAALAALALPAAGHAAAAAPAPAAEPAPGAAPVAAEASDQGTDIVVIAQRIRGQVDAPQPPVATLNEADIEAYGASSLADLITAIAPQTGSARGRGSGGPVILVNGQRISSFREMRNYPPEAIRKVEILPEEVALRFGYSADQRVVNIILKDNFVSRTIEVELGAPGRGGYSAQSVEASMLRINGPSRLNLTASADRTSLLTESERGVIQSPAPAAPVAGDPALADFRSLRPAGSNLSLNAVLTSALGASPGAGTFTLNGTISRASTRSLAGLDAFTLAGPLGAAAYRTLPGALARAGRTATVQAGLTLNKPLGAWQLSATLDATHADSESVSDRRRDASALIAAAQAGTLAVTAPIPVQFGAGSDLATTITNAAAVRATLIGRPFRLPAGDVATTFRAGFAYTGIDSASTRAPGGDAHLRRGDLSAGINLGIPLTSRRENALAAVGDLSLNLSAGIDRYSDFGTLTDWSAGLTWSPVEKLSLGASYLVNQAAPTLANLGSPRIVAFNVPVFDFTRGQTTLATVTSGGNPGLIREEQRDIKLSATWELPFLNNSNLIAEYYRNSSRNPVIGFPLLTPAIEAAFPGRVTRDASGAIVAVDQRAINIASQNSSRLRFGVNLVGTLGPAPAGGGGGGFGGGRGGRGGGGGGGPPRGDGAGRGGPPGSGVGGVGGGGGGMMAMMRGGGQGRWNIALYDTVRFTDRVLLAPGGRVLDLLGGDALSGGGSARHTIELDAGGFYKGFGLRASGSYTAPTRVAGSGLAGSTDLRFGGLALLDLRLFADLGQRAGLVKAVPFLKGTRLSLRAENVLDQRQRVTDSAGLVPLSYQPDYLDPKGRYFEIELRKLF